MSTTISPTFHAFDDAMDYVVSRVTGVSNSELLTALEQLYVVHAICKLPNGTRYTHAWVEEGEWCFSKGMLNGEELFYSLNKEEFYKLLDVQHVTRYSMREACELNVKYHSYGPWRAEYRALSKEDGR